MVERPFISKKCQMKNIQKFEYGGWTPALKSMAIDVMDNLILRPSAAIISDPRNGNVNTFQGVREKLTKRKYATVMEWKEDVMKILASAQQQEETIISSVCNELRQWFLKRYEEIEELSNYQFQNALSRISTKIEKLCGQKTE